MNFRLSHPEDLISESEHFGLTQDSYCMSFGDAGILGFEIALSGLSICEPQKLDNWGYFQYVAARTLFEGAFTEAQKADSDTSPEYYWIQENVIEFAKHRGVHPMTVIQVGRELLGLSVQLEAGPEQPLDLRSGTSKSNPGRLDSRLFFGISPLNTVSLTRENVTRRAKLADRLLQKYFAL